VSNPNQRDYELPGRSVVMGRRGMAATSHPTATLTAINILQAGGNAIDAAVAACTVQCVVEPGSTGIGGDCFVLMAKSGSDKVLAYDGSGRAPAAATLDWYLEQGFSEIPRQSPHAVTIPGSVEAWATLVKDHGRLPLAQLLQPAIDLARDGYVVAPRAAADWAGQAALMAKDEPTARVFLPEGRAPRAGEVHHQRELAATLQAIAETGPSAFYEGAIAQDMVDRLRELGGLHTLEDFRDAKGGYVTPIKTRFRGHDVFECPPAGQGVIALMILNILSGFEPGEDPLSADRLHVEIEASRLAYSVRDAVLADPSQSAVPLDWLLSEELAAQLRSQIDLKQAIKELPSFAPTEVEHADTVYISVVDGDGMAVSFINSVFHPFGAALVAPKSGVLLQNRGQGFVLKPGHPNAIAPRKRPLHTIIPGMMLRDGKVCLSFGVMGGHYQAMGHAHLISKLLDYGLDLQSAISLPRIFPRPGQTAIEAEKTVPAAVRAELERRGFVFTAPGAAIGGGQAIAIDPVTGVLSAGSDHRKDGCALGW
jgi:gamma-glutamyltranspeptidase/glutathione hydrolase